MTVGGTPTDPSDAFSASRKCEPQRSSHRSLWTLGFTLARVRPCLLAPRSYRYPPTLLRITSLV